MIDPAMGWLKIAEIPTKDAYTVANEANLKWFTWYFWPNEIFLDRDQEFMGEFTKNVEAEYGLKQKPITVAIVEQVHQTIGNILQSLQSQKMKKSKKRKPFKQ